MRPLKIQVYHSLQVRRMLEKEIKWLELLVEHRDEIGEKFDELKDVADERKEVISEAEPMFNTAIEVMQGLKKEDLAVMRKYEHPPQLILETMEAAMIIRGDENASWEEAKFLLCDTYFFAFFISKAKYYDKDSLTDNTLKKLSKFIVSPDFEPNVVAEASVPCSAICQWIRALYEHGKLCRITQPQKRSRDELETNLGRARDLLQEKQAETAGAEQKLDAFQKEFAQRRCDLKDRYDQTMSPLQERFLEAHYLYGETFCSPVAAKT